MQNLSQNQPPEAEEADEQAQSPGEEMEQEATKRLEQLLQVVETTWPAGGQTAPDRLLEAVSTGRSFLMKNEEIRARSRTPTGRRNRKSGPTEGAEEFELSDNEGLSDAGNAMVDETKRKAPVQSDSDDG